MKQLTCMLLVISFVDPTITIILISIILIYNGLTSYKGIRESFTDEKIEDSKPFKEDEISDIIEMLEHLKISE